MGCPVHQNLLAMTNLRRWSLDDSGTQYCSHKSFNLMGVDGKKKVWKSTDQSGPIPEQLLPQSKE